MLTRTAMATGMATRRTLVTSAVRASGGFNRPGPPPLPAQEQKEFENLVKQKQSKFAALIQLSQAP